MFSTLHTNDAPGAITRLIDMGVKPFLVASSLTLVVAQRLVRRPCSACAGPYIPSPRTMDLLGLKREDLIDGLEEPIGAATALREMREAAVPLFI